MNVQNRMTSDVKSCGLKTNLVAAASMMWEYDCGVLPVVNEVEDVVRTYKTIRENRLQQVVARA